MLKPISFRVHIGTNWHVTVTDEMMLVDIRRWYTKGRDGTLHPSQVGIALTFIKWNNLKTVIDEVKEEFEDVESCWHLSQHDLERCQLECTMMPSSSRTISVAVAAAADDDYVFCYIVFV